MNSCEMVERGLCLGCVGLAEENWVGKEQCKKYQELKQLNGYDLCKKIIEQIKMEGYK